MPWSPASSSSAMNGAVFQTSATITTAIASGVDASRTRSAPGSPSASSTCGRNPVPVSVTVCQTIAETIVSTAYGTRIVARSSARPRKAAFMISAIPSPISSSRLTEISAKTAVCQNAAQKSDDAIPAAAAKPDVSPNSAAV